MQQLALQALQDMFTETFRKDIRLQYLLKSLLNIVELKSVVQSISIATSVISIINIDQGNAFNFNQGFNNQDDDLYEDGEEENK